MTEKTMRGALLRACGVAAFAALSLAGCGGENHTPPAATTPDSAKAELTATLDAWKAGEEAQALSQRDQPIYVGDEDWQAGAKLAGYTIGGEAETIGLNVEFPVALEVEQGGRRQRKNVRYRVATEPVVSIMRSDR
jgi:hypothetical protein